MTDWTPLCFTPDELAAWQAANRQTSSKDKGLRPCVDCTWPFALKMRAAGKCNGVPDTTQIPDPERLVPDLD